MDRGLVVGLALSVAATSALAQTPQPFPRPGVADTRPAAPPAPATQAPAPAPPRPATTAPAATTAPSATDPDPALLGVPLYPGAQFLTSYDAGRGQRYYLYGVSAPFADMVTFYRTQLKERGALVFEEPPTHTFEVGRFREETMAFPPGITVKDWTYGGSQGYPNPRRGTQPARFPTVLMIVPPPSPAATPASSTPARPTSAAGQR